MQLHVVTGKGGTGKSTVAAALALALASRGRNVLLCEVEGRQGIARMFDVDPLPYEERRIATGLPGPDGAPRRGPRPAHRPGVRAAGVPRDVLQARPGRARRSTASASSSSRPPSRPGVRDVLLTGKVYEAAQRNSAQQGRDRQYDAVVLDAPPTGRIAQFLNVNNELAGLAKMGPIKSQADTVMTLFRSPRTAVHLVTVLEEMPVQETADGIAELRTRAAPGRRGGGQPGPPARPRRRATSRAIRAEQGRPGRGRGRPRVGPGIDGDDDAGRRAARRGRATTPSGARSRTPSASVVAALDVPTYELPRLAGGVDLGGLYELAAAAARSRGWHEHPTTARSGSRARVGPLGPQTPPAAHARRRRPARRPAAPGSSCAAARAASARPRRPRPWPCGPPSAAAGSSCSPSTRPAGWRSRWASRSSTTPRARSPASTPRTGGGLDAMMLDMKRTFDEVVESQASPGEGAADPGEPLLHRAVELLRGHAGVHGDGEARADPRATPSATGTYDLIVVDTPPSRSALDFLDAPERLSSFLDGRFIRLLLAPARGPARLMTAGLRAWSPTR